MRNAIKSIGRMKLMSFLVVLELIVSLTILNTVTLNAREQAKKMNNFSKLYNFENTFNIRTLIKYDAFLDESEKEEIIDIRENLQKMITEINDNREVKNELENLKNKGAIKKLYYNFPCPWNDFQQYCNSTEQQFQSMVNYDFINNYNLKIVDGRGFTKEDFDKDYTKETIPVVLGPSYMDKVKVGDIIEVEHGIGEQWINNNVDECIDEKGECKVREFKLIYEVIGFYGKNEYPILFIKTQFFNNLQFSDNVAIIPCIKGLDKWNQTVIVGDYGAFVELNSRNDIDIVKSNL